MTVLKMMIDHIVDTRSTNSPGQMSEKKDNRNSFKHVKTRNSKIA